MNFLPSGLTLAALLFHPGSTAPSASAERETKYWAMVEQYAQAPKSGTVAAAGAWNGKDLGEIVQLVGRLAKAARQCADCEARVRFDAVPLHAAVLLHGDRERAEHLTRMARQDGEPECSTGTHANTSERLLEFAVRQTGGEAFVARFAAAISLHYRASLCFAIAGNWADAGLKWNPRDAGLLMARGLSAEAIGVFGYAPSPVASGHNARKRATAVSSASDKRGHLDHARESFEKALAENPHLVEARVRLGRVQWRLGRLAAARESLEKAVSEGGGPNPFLAHLFLGRVLEDSQDLEGAVREYRAALAREPHIQAAKIALAHTYALRGDADGARAVLAGGPAPAGRRATVDPYWNYLIGTSQSAETLMEALRIRVKR